MVLVGLLRSYLRPSIVPALNGDTDTEMSHKTTGTSKPLELRGLEGAHSSRQALQIVLCTAQHTQTPAATLTHLAAFLPF